MNPPRPASSGSATSPPTPSDQALRRSAGLQLPEGLGGGREAVVVDVEGNGGQPPEIIEMAVLELRADRVATVADVRTWLVRPVVPISTLVTRKVHGIANTDVADAPPWAEVAGEIAKALSGRVLVAHNASVERRVLGAHLPGWEPPLVIDTLRLAKAVWPDLQGGYGLDRLITYADLAAPPDARPDASVGRRHRAGYDTWMTAALFVALLHDLADAGLSSVVGESAVLDWTGLSALTPPPHPARAPAAGSADLEPKGGLW